MKNLFHLIFFDNKLEKEMNLKKMFKILGAKNRRKNLHKHPSPPFQIRGRPGSSSILSQVIR